MTMEDRIRRLAKEISLLQGETASGADTEEAIAAEMLADPTLTEDQIADMGYAVNMDEGGSE